MSATQVTLLAAIIAAIAAIISPLLAAIINARHAYRLQTAELFFKAKIEAYKSFLSYTANFPLSPSTSEMQKLQEYASQSILLSSPHVQSCIAEYAQYLLNLERTPASIDKSSQLYKNAVLAMQDDLMKRPRQNKK